MKYIVTYRFPSARNHDNALTSELDSLESLNFILGTLENNKYVELISVVPVKEV